MPTILERLTRFFNPQPLSAVVQASAVSVQVDDSSGWMSLTGQPHDYDPAQVQELYQDALTAWRKNPIAWRIIGITTDYVVGDNIQVNSSHRKLDKFISEFWNHPKNRVSLRLETMCEELSRAGDIFVLLFRNDKDGMSYMRFVTKDQIERIETAPNDWETELTYYQTQDIGDPKVWKSPETPEAENQAAIMLHYSINRPMGALLGESDITTMIPWLQRYSRMLEDRVRLHWAARAFLWLVTVPANKVAAKSEQYRTPPEAGSIIVKDESETWEVHAPMLRGSDASHDMQGVRGMIDAGSGYPPHWRGESGDANLATATAMQAPTERHLLRRQKYFSFIIQDILFHAYQRAREINPTKYSNLPTTDYNQLFVMNVPDVSRSDNQVLASAAKDISTALASLAAYLAKVPPTYAREALRMAFKFAGEPLREEQIDEILQELELIQPEPDEDPPSPGPNAETDDAPDQ